MSVSESELAGGGGGPGSVGARPRVLSGIPIGRMGEPEKIVGPVLFLASEAASMVTGVLLPVDGGNLALNATGTLPMPD